MLSMWAVVKDDEEAERQYRGYFGKRIGTVSQIGLEKWVETELADWISRIRDTSPEIVGQERGAPHSALPGPAEVAGVPPGESPSAGGGGGDAPMADTASSSW
jgi:hypothetical protein